MMISTFRSTAPAALACAALVLASCAQQVPEPDDLATGVPSLSTNRLEFETVLTGVSGSARLELTNNGDGMLTLDEVVFSTVPGVSFNAVPAPVTLQPDESVVLRFSVRSDAEVELEARATLKFDGGAEQSVALVGRVVQPACELTETIDFGSLRPGGSRTSVATLRNLTAASVSIELALGSGFEPQMFRFADGFTAGPRELAPESVLEIPLVFGPTALGTHHATVTVKGPAGCGQRVLQLTGNAVERMLASDTAELDFGYVHPGLQRTATFRLQAVDADVTIDSVRPPALAPFSVDPALKGTTIPSGGEREVQVTFAPASMGAVSTTLELSTSDGAPPLKVLLKGHGGGPKIEVPDEIAFGPVAIGTTQRRTVLIRNVGSDADASELDNLLLGTSGAEPYATIEGDVAGDFSLVTPTSTYPADGIAAGRAAGLEVQFTANGAGPRAARLIIHSNDPAAPRSEIPLSARADSYPSCEFEVSTQRLDFGKVREWTKVELPIVIRNPGTAAADVCHLFRAELDPAGASSFELISAPTMPLALEPGESTTLLVRFSAPAAALSRSTLELSTSSAAHPELRIALEGSSEGSCVVIDRPVLDFGIVAPSCPATTATLGLSNHCGSPLQLDSVQIHGALGSAFDLRNLPAGPIQLGTGGYQLPVTFAATSPGAHEAELTIASTQSGERRVVRLTGRTGAERTEWFAPPPQEVDVLWLVDNSGSSPVHKMFEIANLFPEFMDEAVRSGLDVNVAVTGMSLGCKDCPEGRFVNGAKGSINENGPRILKPQMSDFYARIRTFFDMGNPPGLETPLEAMRLALSEPLVSGINSGFRRADARLVVMLATDDMDRSTGSLEYYQSFLETLAPMPGQVVVSGLVPLLPSSPGGGCAYSSGGVGQLPWFRDFFARFGGTPEEICTADMAASLRRLGAQAFGSRTVFPLAQAAGAIQQVRVGSRVLLEIDSSGRRNWKYDAVKHAVSIEPAVAPEPADAVEITYTPECTP